MVGAGAFVSIAPLQFGRIYFLGQYPRLLSLATTHHLSRPASRDSVTRSTDGSSTQWLRKPQPPILTSLHRPRGMCWCLVLLVLSFETRFSRVGKLNWLCDNHPLPYEAHYHSLPPAPPICLFCLSRRYCDNPLVFRWLHSCNTRSYFCLGRSIDRSFSLLPRMTTTIAMLCTMPDSISSW